MLAINLMKQGSSYSYFDPVSFLGCIVSSDTGTKDRQDQFLKLTNLYSIQMFNNGGPAPLPPPKKKSNKNPSVIVNSGIKCFLTTKS